MREKRLRLLMKQKKLDLVMISSPKNLDFEPNMMYYTGFSGAGMLIFKKKAVLLTNAIEYEKAKKTGFRTVMVKKATKKGILKKEIGKARRIGIDKSSISISEYEELRKIRKAKFIDIGKELVMARAVKEDKEIRAIRKACEICDDIFTKIVTNFRFKKEKELADFITMEMRKKGLEPSFNPIISSGKNGSDIHHNPSGKIDKGFLILDFGCKVEGYCSDMTRTIYVGKPSDKEKQVYYNLLNVQEAAVRLAKPGKKCKELYNFCKAKLGEPFSHNLGHGVGLEIHESPNLSPESEDVLKEGMCITIEPGVYESGKYGMRIEDTLLVTRKGVSRLTTSGRMLISVKK